jgi:hypothetical protein
MEVNQLLQILLHMEVDLADASKLVQNFQKMVDQEVAKEM